MNKVDSNKRNQKRCTRCLRIVGVDYTGEKHKCECRKKVKVR